MVNPETEQILAKILINLAKGERKSEIAKQVLCENPDFNPFQLFKLIDKQNKNYIDSTSLMNFLISKGISINNYESQLIILFYDLNYDNILSFDEFINLIKPQNIQNFSNVNSNSKNYPISFNIGYSFTKLLEKEIELARKVIYLLNQIKRDKNFNIHELYHKVKISNFIDEEGIKNFLNKNCEYYLDSDIRAILKRLDLNKDGKVDLCEFHAFLGFPNCFYCCPCTACCHCGTCYCKICFCNCHCKYHKKVHRSYNSPIKNNRNCDKNNKYEMNQNYNNNNEYNIQNYNLNQGSDNNNYNISYSYNSNPNINNNYNNRFNNGRVENNNNINYNGLLTKTEQVLENNYFPMRNSNEEKIIQNNYSMNINNENDRNMDSQKISKSLTIRPSPERKNLNKPYHDSINKRKQVNNDFMEYGQNNNNINSYNLYKGNYYENNEENLNYNNQFNLDENQMNNGNLKPYIQGEYEENQMNINNFPTYNQGEYEENQINNDNLKPYNQDEYQENQINNDNLPPYNQDEYEENQFNEFIRQIMLAEGQLEKIKISLAMRPDFNCEDCFRIFEVNGKGVLYPEDIKTGLNLIGVFYSDFEVQLLFKRYDLQNRGHINYSDFFDIFVPFQKEYRKMVEERKPNSCCPCRCPEVFCDETISILKNLMDAIIKYENNFNFMRRGFTTLNLKLKHIFGNIDFGNKGYFDSNELNEFLKRNKIYNNSLEADLLFIRLDKNRNGKIDYKEIYDETHPLYNLN